MNPVCGIEPGNCMHCFGSTLIHGGMCSISQDSVFCIMQLNYVGLGLGFSVACGSRGDLVQVPVEKGKTVIVNKVNVWRTPHSTRHPIRPNTDPPPPEARPDSTTTPNGDDPTQPHSTQHQPSPQRPDPTRPQLETETARPNPIRPNTDPPPRGPTPPDHNSVSSGFGSGLGGGSVLGRMGSGRVGSGLHF